MPSGPKKRRAARRKKQEMAISESPSNSNSNSEPSPKVVEDENEEVFKTPKSEPELPLSESESVYYSVEVKKHSRRGSSDEFKSLDFEDNSQERLNDFKLEEKDNINVNFDDRGSRGEEFHNEIEDLKECKLDENTYVTEVKFEEAEQKMSFDDKNAKILPWLGESICTGDFLNVNGSVDETSKEELHISVDANSEKVDLDMALKNREISRDMIMNVMEEKVDNEEGITLIEKSDSPEKNFAEAIGISTVDVNDQEAGLWLDKEIQNIDSDEYRNSNAELHKELPTAHENYKNLDLSKAAKDKCIKDMKLDEFLHVTDNKSSADEDKLQIEVGQKIIEKSLPFDEKTALKALVEAVVVSPSEENEVKVVPWLYNDIPTEYVDVNVDVEVLQPEKEIAGFESFDSTETLNICQEYDLSKCTSFESIDGSIRHNISNPRIHKAITEVQGLLPQIDVELICNELENSAEKSLGREKQQTITSNENPNDLNGGQVLHPQIEVDLISNELGKSIEKSSRLVDSSILVCDEKSIHETAIENLGEEEEDILPPIESSKDSVNGFNAEILKDSSEVQEIQPLTEVKLIGNDIGKSVEKSSGLVESFIPIREEEGINVTPTENSVEHEVHVLPLIESSTDSINIFNIENSNDSAEFQEILPTTDVELISNDLGPSVEKSSGLVESSILTCEAEDLNVTAFENSGEQEDSRPLIESPKDSVSIFDTENPKDSADVQEIPPQTDVELISNDFGKTAEKSSSLVENSIPICEEEDLNGTAVENSVEQEDDIQPLIEKLNDLVNIFNTENTDDSTEFQEIPPPIDVESIGIGLGKPVEKCFRFGESSILICEEKSSNVTATENLIEQEEAVLPVIDSAKDSVHANQEIHHLTDVVFASDELHESANNSPKYLENSICEKEGLQFVNVEKLNEEIHINTASSQNSVDMVEEKLSSDSVNNQFDETADKCARLDENSVLNSGGINQNSHDYLESSIGSRNSSQPSMKQSADFSPNSGQIDHMKKNEVSPKAKRPHTTIWNCCGLLEAFTSSDK